MMILLEWGHCMSSTDDEARTFFNKSLLKEYYPSDLWDSLRQEYPDLLDATPTEGRSIQWSKIDAAEPPLFGATTVGQLAWRDGGTQACVEASAEQSEKPAPTCATRKHFLLLWAVGFLLSIVLLSLRAVSDSQALRIYGNVFVCLCVGTGLPVLAMMLVNYLAANPGQGLVWEVYCFRGESNEPPYLANVGRWGPHRALYYYVLFGGIAVSSLCLVNGNIRFLRTFGAFLLSAILLFYVGITLLVNVMDLYRRPLPSHFINSMMRVCFYCTVLSIGVGILAGYHDLHNGKAAGAAFSAIGAAGLLAELAPRLRQQRADSFNDAFIHRPPNIYRNVLGYIACIGAVVGSLMLVLSEVEPGHIIRIAGSHYRRCLRTPLCVGFCTHGLTRNRKESYRLAFYIIPFYTIIHCHFFCMKIVFVGDIGVLYHARRSFHLTKTFYSSARSFCCCS